ncbi:MAG: cupin-like domain-containing protein [Sphingomonadaceae bacterium]
MSNENFPPDGKPVRVLPPLPPSQFASPEEALARQQARDARDAQIRGVTSITAMRDAIRAAARTLPPLQAIPRFGVLDAATFLARARQGQPFLMTGLVQRWPLSKLEPHILREQYAHLPVRARVGDYINTAFAADRAMQDMTMGEYLALVDSGVHALPPYLGNLELRELNRLCHWPTYFSKMGPPRFWVGPVGTRTPLHCDYDDNIFAQIWGRKRIYLAPPHHDEFLYTRQANAILFGSPFDPSAPDFEAYPLARQANMIEFVVEPGDMLYVPAGWYLQVMALSFSLSSNRWARAMPLALHDDPALQRL